MDLSSRNGNATALMWGSAGRRTRWRPEPKLGPPSRRGAGSPTRLLRARLDAERLQLGGEVCARRASADRFVDVEDLAVRSDVERPTAREASGAQHAVLRGDLFRRVAQHRKVGLFLFRELPVLFRGVD